MWMLLSVQFTFYFFIWLINYFISVVLNCTPSSPVFSYSWAILISLSLIFMAIAIIRIITKNWRLLFYFQWRSVLLLCHFSLTALLFCLTQILKKSDVYSPSIFQYPICVADHPRDFTPPCVRSYEGYYWFLVLLYVLMYSSPAIMCGYVYLTNSITLKWWYVFVTKRVAITSMAEISKSSLNYESINWLYEEVNWWYFQMVIWLIISLFIQIMIWFSSEKWN